MGYEKEFATQHHLMLSGSAPRALGGTMQQQQVLTMQQVGECVIYVIYVI